MAFDIWPFRRKAVTVADLPAEILALGASKSGKSVTISNALKVATVFACVRVLSEDLAQMPLKLYLEAGRDKLPAKDHALYDVLHRQPNDVATSFGFRETLVIHAALTGQAFAFINRSMGEVVELINIEPGAVTVNRSDRMGVPPTYTIRGKNGSAQTFPASAILHLRGPSWDGIVGMEPVRLARDAIGLAMATEEAHSRMHANGSRPGGLLSVEGTLKDDQYKTLRKWIEDNYQGSDNAYRTMILDRSAKFMPMALSGVDAQHLETRRFQIEEVCRFMRVLPIMVCSSDKSTTYASSEQMFLAHVVHTLAPWCGRIEQTLDCQLLSKAERRAGYYVKHVMAGLLRGALKDTAEYLYKLVSIGILTRNEARDKLEYNPVDGLDEPLTPINLSADLAGKTEGENANA